MKSKGYGNGQELGVLSPPPHVERRRAPHHYPRGAGGPLGRGGCEGDKEGMLRRLRL